MWRFIVLGIIVLSMSIVGRGEDTNVKGDLTIAGVGVVPAPAEGYTWKKIQESLASDSPSYVTNHEKN